MASLYPRQMEQMLFSTPHHPFEQQQNEVQQSQDFDLGDCIELESVQFVSPHEIHPIVSPDSAVSQVSSKSINTPEIGEQMPINDMKLKMEEFGDLTALFSGASKIDLTGATDELGTPIFDKDAFNFANPPIKSIENNQTDSKVKVEFNAQYYSYGGKHIYRDLSLGTAANNVQNKENYSISRVVVGENQPEMNLYQPFAHNNLSFKDHTNDTTTTPYRQDLSPFDSMATFNDTSSFDSNLGVNFNNIKCSTSAVPSPQDDRYSYISSPGDDELVEFNIPDLDNLYKRKQRPNLMIDQFKFPIKSEGLMVLNTPDVIDDVVNMGTDFNILDLVNNEDITILNPDEELLQSLSSPSMTSFPPSTPSTSSSKPASPKKFQKRRLSYDDNDDEDYVPPTKKKSTICLADLDIEESDSSNDSYYETKKTARKPGKPRGRPRKRTDSVSSDYSKDSPNPNLSKYRELRDKNNEASRKSRLKRRQKEMEYEQEAEELRSRNLRLKTQVEELEKLVTTWRNNLLKVIISK